ncbi:MAG: TonB-dependent receptor, partial [Pseudomonadota bacterium]
ISVTGAHAQTGSSGDVEVDDIIIVTGTTRPLDIKKLGNAITVIDAEKLESTGITYVSDALRQVPGLAVNRTGPFGGITQVRVRGAEANQVLVLLDGVDISPAGSGETDLSTLLAGDIQRLEVLRGPQSGLYGSNALAGVINVITQRDVDGWYANLSGEAGTFDTRQGTLSFGIGDGESSLSGGITIIDTDGFDSSVGGAFNGPPELEGDLEGNELQTYYLRGVWAATETLRLEAFGRYVNKSSELDGFDFSGIPGQQGLTFDDASFQDNEDFNIGGRGVLSLMDGDWVSIASISYTDSRTDGGTFGSESTRTNYRLQSSYSWGGPGLRQTGTLFADLEDETFRNTQPFDPSQIPTQSRELFGFGLEYRAEIDERIFISGTVRHDVNDDFDDATTWSVAGSVLAGDTTRIHASVGAGVTNPTFFEQFGFTPGFFVGNPDLDPESAIGWDIGVEQTFLDGQAIIDVTYFNSTLENEITSIFPTVVNDTGESNRSGVEVSWSFFPVDNFDLIGTYTYLDATDPDGTVEVRRPTNTASLDANWRFLEDRAQLTMGVTYNGDQLDNDFTAGFSPVKVELDRYALVRLQGTYRFNDQFEIYARGENVFDADYVEVANFATPGAAVYAGARFKFGSN